MGLIGKLVYKLGDLDEITVGNFIDLLKDLQGILNSLKDDMKQEGGREVESLE
jgi:hypothetical protein